MPSQRQTRLDQQLVCGQPARLAPLENGSRDVRGEYNIFRKVQRAGAVGLVLDQIRTTPRLGRVSPNFTLSPAISFLPHLPENRNFPCRHLRLRYQRRRRIRQGRVAARCTGRRRAYYSPMPSSYDSAAVHCAVREPTMETC